jgi:hypothetical protein
MQYILKVKMEKFPDCIWVVRKRKKSLKTKDFLWSKPIKD